MNKLNKVLTTLLATVTAAASMLSLTSCFVTPPNKTPTGEVEVVAYDGREIEIEFHHSMGQTLQGAVDRAISKFNKIYPNIKVKSVKVANDYATLLKTISEKLNGSEDNLPCVAYCYPDHVATYNSGKKIVALDPYINSTAAVTSTVEGEVMGLTQAQKDDYFEVFYNEGSQYGDGKTYSLPFNKSTEVMYYNKTFFQDNNLMEYVEKTDANGNPISMTWDEMEELCGKILKIDSNCYPLGYDSESNWFITMAEQSGSEYTSATGNYFRFNNETNRKFVKRFADWYDKGYVTTQELYGNYTSNLFNVYDSSKLKCYMCIGSTGGAAYQVGEKVNIDGKPQYPFEVGVTQIPQVDPANPKVIQQGPSVCIFKKTDPQKVAASWLFVKYFTTNAEFQADVSLTNGYTPVVKSALQHPGYVAQLNALNETQGKERNAYLQLAVVQQTVNQMNTYFTSPVFAGSSTARTQVGLLMQNCLENAMDESDPDAYIAERFAIAIEDLEYEFGKGK